MEGEQKPTQTLAHALDNGLNQDASPFAATVLTACIMGRIMDHCSHLKDLGTDTTFNYENLVHEQKTLDNIITNTFLSLPEHLRFLTARQGPIVAFLNMCLHAASICLHSAAIDRSAQCVQDTGGTSISQRRCRNGAEGILLIMRISAHLDPAQVSHRCFKPRLKP